MLNSIPQLNTNVQGYNKNSVKLAAQTAKSVATNPINEVKIPASAYRQLALPKIAPSFGSAHSITKYADFDDLIKFLKSFDNDEATALKKMLIETINDGVVLGEGKLNKVFSIPKTEYFVLRINKNAPVCTGKVVKAPMLFPDLNLGQPVANILASNGSDVQILRKASGESIGVPFSIRKSDEKLRLSGMKNFAGEDLFIKNSEKIASIDQKAYDDLSWTQKIKQVV